MNNLSDYESFDKCHWINLLDGRCFTRLRFL